jgi:tetratricopeptide (TPR) repeat protein
VEQLAAVSSGWQNRLAAELARSPRRKNVKKATVIFRWAGMALAATLLVALGLTAWWHHETAPERLLAQAYSQSRNFDLRIPGAGYGVVIPASHLRGGSTGREPAALSEAQGRIERQLQRSPQNAHWLQMEARLDLLEEKLDPAIDVLDRLLAAGPVTSSLLVDDATAYFQRGSFSGSESDRATALNRLRRADELDPANPAVLFNEAIVMEDRGQAINAVETWNRYLLFERDPLWRAEGQQRLQAVELKLNSSKTH